MNAIDIACHPIVDKFTKYYRKDHAYHIVHILNCITLNLGSEHPGMTPNIVTEDNDADRALLVETVTDLQSRVDHVIVSFHWGVPGKYKLLDYQRTVGHLRLMPAPP